MTWPEREREAEQSVKWSFIDVAGARESVMYVKVIESKILSH